MAGRGRGRGRGITSSDIASALGGLAEKNIPDSKSNNASSSSTSSSSTNTATTTTTTPTKASSPTTESATLSEEDIQNILKDSRTYSDQYNLKKVLMLVQNFVRSENDVKTVACTIYQKCMEDSSLAKRGAEICDRLTCIESGNAHFRKSLLSLVQGDYKIRRDIYKQSPVHYNGFLAFLCEIFNVMRTQTGDVFKPLIVPIYDCLGLVLGLGLEEKEETEKNDDDGDYDEESLKMAGKLDEDSCDILKTQLQEVGKLLERHDEGRMRQLMNRVRTCIIHSESPPRVRCSLLEVIESYTRSWESAPNDTTKYYLDMDVHIISGLVL